MNRRRAMDIDLFSRLAKYRPTDKKQSVENFLTELIVHLLQQESVIRAAFVRMLDRGYTKEVSREQISTQVSTRSRKAKLSGLYLDFVIGTEGSDIIVENKVDSLLTEAQLNNYLEYAEEKNARVAVITKYFDRVANECRNPRFLGPFFWSEFADEWSQIDGISNEYLLKGVLEFMRSLGMGPVDPISEDELKAHHRWLSLNDKMRRLIQDWGNRKIDTLTFEQCRGLKYRSLFESGGHLGLGWCAPAESSPSSCSFWYFLGFAYNGGGWSLPLYQREEPECTAFVGVWPGNADEFVEVTRNLCPRLISNDFQLVRSRDGRGVFLARRRGLRSFLGSSDQRSAVAGFLEDSHNEVMVSAELPKLYEAFLAGAAGSTAPSHEEL
jgi:hypothetical protein